MASPNYTILFDAQVSGTAIAGSAGDVLIPDATTGLYTLATTAARAGRRSTGLALGTYQPLGVVGIQQVGQVDPVTAGLGAGTASWVRVSTAGRLERATVSGADDVVGYVETDGTFHAMFGILTAAIVNGSGGGATLPILLGSQVSGTLPVANGGTGVTSLTLPTSTIVGTTDAQTLSNKTIAAGSNIITGLTPANDVAASAMAALAIDWSVAAVFTKTLSAGANTITFANASSGRVIMVRLTGAVSTVTWPTVKWAGGVAPTQTASGTDVYTFVHDGTSIYGSVVQAMA